MPWRGCCVVQSREVGSSKAVIVRAFCLPKDEGETAFFVVIGNIFGTNPTNSKQLLLLLNGTCILARLAFTSPKIYSFVKMTITTNDSYDYRTYLLIVCAIIEL